MFSGLFTTLGGFMLNPALAMLGVAAIASPILIHLLNKRKFRKVEWAAMDFLLEADKKNRRRVRLENLILLLLRCLACILIGLLLARPINQLKLMAGLMNEEEFERIVLLDDSISMLVENDSKTSMDNAKESLVQFVRGLASTGHKELFTLYLASNPTQPVYGPAQIDTRTAEEIAADIEDEVQVSDRPAHLDNAIREIEKAVAGASNTSVNRVVYVISDMRTRDWPVADADDENSVTATLKRIGNDTVGCFLVDVGRDDDVGNVYVEDIRAQEKALVSGVQSQFEVTVRNTGRRDVNDVKVRFAAADVNPEDAIGLEVEIPSIKAGESETVPFAYTFAPLEVDSTGARPDPVRIRADLIAPEAKDGDELVLDNKRYFAARVVPGIQTLIVDGDPSAERFETESFFLRAALNPRGNTRSGMAIKVVTDVEFETVRLDDFQIIWLLNLYRIPDERQQALEKWVANGGGLVIALGDQLDEELYNRQLYKGGKGLLPLQLDEVEGDPEEEKWTGLNIVTKDKEHPVVRAFSDQGAMFLEFIKIFRWWKCDLDEKALKAGKVNVLARFTDPDQTPAIVEKPFGKGRVVVFTTPLDDDWNNWVQDHSYAATMLYTNNYLARKTSDSANVQVGEPLHQSLDLTDYELDVAVKRPDQKTSPVEASPAKETTGEQVLYRVDYDEIDRQGFYEMILNRRDAGGAEPVLFAANIDAREGDLRRANTQELSRKLTGSKVQFIEHADLSRLSADSAKNEWWRWVLGGLVLVLGTEQFLAWWWGRKR